MSDRRTDCECVPRTFLGAGDFLFAGGLKANACEAIHTRTIRARYTTILDLLDTITPPGKTACAIQVKVKGRCSCWLEEIFVLSKKQAGGAPEERSRHLSERGLLPMAPLDDLSLAS